MARTPRSRPRPLRRTPPLLTPPRAPSQSAGGEGFVYDKEELLQIYRDGKFRDIDFEEKFIHVTNATTPEYLVPLALLPITDEETELRKNPVMVGVPGGQGGRGRGFGDGERGRGGKGGKGKGDGKGRSEGSRGDGQWGRDRDRSGSCDVRNSGGGTWETQGGRGARESNERHSNHADANSTPPADKRQAGAQASAPAPPKDWFYRDLEGTIQGPFNESQISEWFSAGYLPTNLPMRPADSEAYVPLNELVRAGNGEPPFVRANRLRAEFEAAGGGAAKGDAATKQQAEAAAKEAEAKRAAEAEAARQVPSPPRR